MADDDLSNDGDFDEGKDEATGDVSENGDNAGANGGDQSHASDVDTENLVDDKDDKNDDDADISEDEDNEDKNGGDQSDPSDVDIEKLDPEEVEPKGATSEDDSKESIHNNKESDASDADPDNLENDENAAGVEPLEAKDELEGEPGKKSKKKVIIISVAGLFVLLLLAGGGLFWFSSAGEKKKLAEGAVIPPPGYIASVAVPPKKRKRMKSGRELARSKANLKPPKMRRMTPGPAKTEDQSTETAPQATKAFGSTDKTEQTPTGLGSANDPPRTVQVIGARVVPGKGLMMPSVTSAAYQAVPMKGKSEPVSAPDESLMETLNGKVVPKVSESGKTSWQAYSHRFTPTLQPAAVGPDGADAKPKEFARICIIVRGLGLNRNATLAAINKLPAAISLAFDPYAKGLEEWASLARGAGHETLMSLPMEPIDFPSSDAGPMALLTDLKIEQNADRLAVIMNLTQAYVGFVQNMGSRFATSEAAFRPVLKILKDRGLLFVDDGLVKGGLGPRLAVDLSLPHARSDLIIDDDASGVKIAQNLLQLEIIAKKNMSSLGLAKKNQTAIGIGEAYPATLVQINRWVKTLKAKMIDLAPVTAVVRNNFVKPAEAATGKAGDETSKEQQ